MNNQLEWIILTTDNYEASRAFYRDILDLKIIREANEEQFTQFELQNCYLAIYGRKEIEKLTGQKFGQGGGAIYTFAETDDIDLLYRKLSEKGVKFIKEPITQSWGQRTAYFTDPDGHIWEIQKWLK